ncbi:MAG: hypothetical protein CMQ38_01830 [Gammaproteobacteria bacterium]|nr:hypothetical protein [Gammaproteobacteria bacterium]
MTMETQQRNVLVSVIFTVLICLIAALAFFTWNLSNEVQALRENNAQPGNITSQAAANNSFATTEPSGPAPAAPNTSGNSPADPVDPLPGFTDPFSNNWPGFMDPGGQIAEMQRRMDELMNSMTRGYPFFNQQDFGFGFSSSPTVSMTEDSEAYRVVIEVPEGQEIELNTELNNNVLVVSGSVRSLREEGNSGLSSRSMQESRFSQSMHLPGDIDEAGMTVDRQDNEIIVTVPKAVN